MSQQALPVARIISYAGGMTCAALSIPQPWASVPAADLAQKAPGLLDSARTAALPPGTEIDVIGALFHVFGAPGWVPCVLVVAALALLTLQAIGVCRIVRWVPLVLCAAGLAAAAQVLLGNPHPGKGVLLLLAGALVGCAGAFTAGATSASLTAAAKGSAA